MFVRLQQGVWQGSVTFHEHFIIVGSELWWLTYISVFAGQLHVLSHKFRFDKRA